MILQVHWTRMHKFHLRYVLNKFTGEARLGKLAMPRGRWRRASQGALPTKRLSGCLVSARSSNRDCRTPHLKANEQGERPATTNGIPIVGVPVRSSSVKRRGGRKPDRTLSACRGMKTKQWLGRTISSVSVEVADTAT